MVSKTRSYNTFFRASSTMKRFEFQVDELSERLLDDQQQQAKLQSFKDLYTGRNKEVQRYYENQQVLLDKWTEVQEIISNPQYYQQQREQEDSGNILVYASMGFNVIFLIMMICLVVKTMLLTIIAVTLDSVLDNLSGAILFQAHRLSQQEDKYNYPLGKYRFELVGIIMFACIMATLQMTVIVESIQQIIMPSFPKEEGGQVLTIIVLLIVIVCKSLLFLFCSVSKNDAVKAYAQDHRNDTINCSFTLVFALLSNSIWPMWDPIGAILISSVLVVSWFGTATEYCSYLIGRVAPPEILQLLTIITFNHSPKIEKIDTIQAFQFGKRYFVEIHVVLPEDMPLKECHDIGEDLQYKVELIPDVERAYVHLDYEYEHSPSIEHYKKGDMHTGSNNNSKILQDSDLPDIKEFDDQRQKSLLDIKVEEL